MDQNDLVIENQQEWSRFSKKGLDTIVDPMVFRTADVYLRGREGAGEALPGQDAENVWAAVSANIDSLAAFFDALILAERLPIIDYGTTFDSNVGYDTGSLYERINTRTRKPLLFSVHVMGAASAAAREAAIAALHERRPAPPALAKSVLQEMSAFDYAWKSDISALGELTPEEERLARFLYGGLLFGGFAQSSGAAHLLQPKRARLQVAMALQAPSAAFDYEGELFETLKQKARQVPGVSPGFFEMNRLPQFLPYLLWKNPSSPDNLLVEALRLRDTRQAREYRKWRAELLDNWRTKGRYDPAIIAKLDGVAKELERKYQPGGNLTLDAKASLGMTGFGVSAGRSIPVGRIWGWIQQQLPGQRYTKLLMRLRLAERTYVNIDRHLRSIWDIPSK